MKTTAIEEPSLAMQPTSTPGSVFGYQGFRLYWTAQLCATLATQMQAVAVGWQVYNLTQRPLDLGLVGLAQFLPALALALVTGHVADRYDRRRVLALCLTLEVLCALLLLALTLRGNTDERLIFGALFLFGIARAFGFPAATALMPKLVPLPHFTQAAAWTSSGRQAATIVGPALGGLLYAFGPSFVYGSGAVLLLLGALLVNLIRMESTTTTRRAVTWDSVVAGVAFIRTQPVVLGAISLDLFAVLLGGATALLPLYARDILHVGPRELGLLRSAPALGALVMALWLARRPITSRTGYVLLVTVGTFGIATIGFGLSRNLWLSLGMLAILGAADMVSVVIRRILVLVATPDEMRGRVSAVESVFIGASNELGEFESGVTAAWFGAVPAVILGGIGTLAVVVLWGWLFPELRQVNTFETPG
ncbi:MAG TPA: MFS transporter [Candidatus Binatia bacterium]|jgi:MFS family permease|nr:MFS transporter [Candidatus Binatia bacterium]